MADERDFSFKCIKIALIVIHSLTIFGLIILLIYSIFILDESDKKSMDFNPEEKDTIQFFGIFLICFSAIGLVIEIIGLVGIIKENQLIVIVFFVLSVLGVIGNFYNFGIGRGFIALGITILTGVYAYKIVKYEKQYV